MEQVKNILFTNFPFNGNNMWKKRTVEVEKVKYENINQYSIKWKEEKIPLKLPDTTKRAWLDEKFKRAII